MHWLTEPSTGADEEKRISVRACKDLREIPGVRNCGSHIGQALASRTRSTASTSARTGSASTRTSTTTTRLPKVHRTVEGYPGLYRDVQTYLRERIKEVLTGTSESIVVRDLRPGPASPAREVGGDRGEDREDRRRHRRAPGLRGGPAARRGRARPRGGAELRPEAGRRSPADLGDPRQRGGQRPLPRGKAYDVHVWSIPSARDSLTDVQELPIDTPDGGTTSASIRWPTCGSRRPRTTSSASSSRAGSTWARTSRDVTSPRSSRTSRSASRQVEFPPGYHAEVLGESTELNAAQDRLFTFGIGAAIAIFLLLQAAFGSLRLAALTFLLLPMALVGGVLAVWLGDGVLSLGSLVGFLTVFGIAARNGILMISHFQHLEREEGMPFGPGARAARGEGAAGADHDDRLRDRPGARAAGGRGQHPRSRDRAPDGDRDPRRPGHLDAAEPVRAAVALPALRQEQEGAQAGGRRARRRLSSGHGSAAVAASPRGRRSPRQRAPQQFASRRASGPSGLQNSFSETASRRVHRNALACSRACSSGIHSRSATNSTNSSWTFAGP